MHDGIPYDRNQGQGQGHSREVDCQSPTGLIFIIVLLFVRAPFYVLLVFIVCILSFDC